MTESNRRSNQDTADVYGFEFDEENEKKFWDHGISLNQVDQILDNEHVVARNRKRRRGLYLVVGLDDSEKCIAVPIEATRDPYVWCPITAFPCKDFEQHLLESG